MQNFFLNLLLCLALLLVISKQAQADKTYVYKESDGTVWFSNVEPEAQDSSRYQLIEVKGRRTATNSCRGMNNSRLAERARNYIKEIILYASQYDIDSKLILAVIRNESCFDRSAVSSAGAQGLMQLMPATARWLGVTDSFSPDQNIRGGTKYLSDLVKRYDNNIKMALAAYNAGPGAVAKYGGVPPYAETQKYIEKVMKSYQDYLRDDRIADADE